MKTTKSTQHNINKTRLTNRICGLIYVLFADFVKQDLKQKIITCVCVVFVLIASVWGIWRVANLKGYQNPNNMEWLEAFNKDFRLTGYEFDSQAKNIRLCEEGDTQACDYVRKKERDRICESGKKYACALGAQKVEALENLCESGNLSACKSVAEIYQQKIYTDYDKGLFLGMPQNTQEKANPYYDRGRYLAYSKKICDKGDIKEDREYVAKYCEYVIYKTLGGYSSFEALSYIKKYCDSRLDEYYGENNKCVMFLFLASGGLDSFENKSNEIPRDETTQYATQEVTQYVENLCKQGNCKIKDKLESIAQEGKKCALGEAIVCLYLADTYAQYNTSQHHFRDFGHSDFEDNTREALPFYERACGLGNAESCLRLAEYYDEYDEGKISYNDMTLHYKDKACNIGDIKTCAVLESIYASKGNKAKSSIYQNKISQHYQKTCSTDKMPQSLWEFDDLQDECVAWKTKQRCDKGNAIECLRFAQHSKQKCDSYENESASMQWICFYEWGEYMEVGAQFYFDKACELGNMLGCEYAGDLFADKYMPFIQEDDKDFSTNNAFKNNALKYYQKACKGGNLGACDKIETLKNQTTF